MKSPEEISTIIPEENEFARYRLDQLAALLDPAKDLLISWPEIRVIKRRMYFEYDYQEEYVPVEADNKLVEKIRNRAAYSMVLDLKEVGLHTEVSSILRPQSSAKI